MTSEEILQEAIKRYPIGTKFKCLHDCKGGPIIEMDHHIDGMGVIRVLGGTGCIYDSGEWAKIISLPMLDPSEFNYLITN